MAVSQCKPLLGEDAHAEREDAVNRRHDNTIAIMGKKSRKGGTEFLSTRAYSSTL